MWVDVQVGEDVVRCVGKLRLANERSGEKIFVRCERGLVGGSARMPVEGGTDEGVVIIICFAMDALLNPSAA